MLSTEVLPVFHESLEIFSYDLLGLMLTFAIMLCYAIYLSGNVRYSEAINQMTMQFNKHLHL